MTDNTQVLLASTPEGMPSPDNFKLHQQAMPVAQPGQVLCETLYLSLDPYMRSQIAGRHISGAIQPGELMLGETVSRVLSSDVEEFKAGDLVRCFAGWQSHSLQDPAALTKLPASNDPSLFLSTLGMPGLTAYAGLIWQAQPKAGDVVVIPAATGGVGSVAGQLAKIYGCRVIGIAGGEEKCKKAVAELGYDACIDRKQGNLAEQLDQLCPNGIDIYFDLVGGELLNTVSERLAVGARVILCGIMSELNASGRACGPHPALWIKARATVYGLVVYDFEARRNEFIDACLPFIEAGTLKPSVDMYDGLAHAPDAFCRLMRGENNGKVIVKI
ncbi:NADP-dependent oxidoreductase [Halioxenophilus sp. WMMB6]|uniref:NADP-dependent oxidoreductase n=1 Tax=Halioxenophilus sp. WMMB6 TaxID=3073815 RepID=UPI00295EBD2D|nr:NADP-dependent oxidoreductase [Halioxenophilus sp. WMMB6]